MSERELERILQSETSEKAVEAAIRRFLKESKGGDTDETIR